MSRDCKTLAKDREQRTLISVSLCLGVKYDAMDTASHKDTKTPRRIIPDSPEIAGVKIHPRPPSAATPASGGHKQHRVNLSSAALLSAVPAGLVIGGMRSTGVTRGY